MPVAGGMGRWCHREMAGVWRLMVRREALGGVRFDTRLSLYEDAMFVSDCLVHARTMTCVNRPLYRVTDRESGAMRTVPRDGRRRCQNKLALLSARERIDAVTGGKLTPLYEGSCVLAAMEMLAVTMRGRLSRREGFSFLRRYLSRPSVRAALVRFPLSVRRPFVLLATLFLKMLACRPAQ